jgi:predicted anti-sigma-YlaC factor YlaD
MSSSVLPSACVQARESISVRLDGELSELDSVRLAAHLRDCSECSAHARELGALAHRLRTAPLERPVLEAWVPRTRVASRSRLVPLRVAAAVLVAATASFLAGHFYAASGPSGGSTLTAAGTSSSPGRDIVQQHILAMLSESHFAPSRPEGRLIFA